MKPKLQNVRSRRLPGYTKCLESLAKPMRKKADLVYENYFCEDPKHKLLRPGWRVDQYLEETVYKVNVGEYRALALVSQEGGVTIYDWYWIGSHEEYNGRIGNK